LLQRLVCYKEYTQVYLAKPLVSAKAPGATSEMVVASAPILSFKLSFSSGSVALDYIHKNSERNISDVIQLLSSGFIGLNPLFDTFFK